MGHVGTKATQALTSTNDVAIISRNKNSLKQTVSNIDRELKEKVLKINDNKAKYMGITRTLYNRQHLLDEF